tara:strand:+ start:191 stop:358 length:168 start_codon:yes stop_codon:yes gene_type:complete
MNVEKNINRAGNIIKIQIFIGIFIVEMQIAEKTVNSIKINKFAILEIASMPHINL